MLRKVFIAATLLLVFFGVGCTAPLRTPVLGLIYTGVKSGEAVSGVAGAQKTGEACAMSILGLIAVGDASIDVAARNGGISQISYMDASHTGILGLYAQHCTVVHGN